MLVWIFQMAPVVILLYVVLYPKYKLATEIVKSMYEKTSLTFYEHVRCMTPFTNNVIIKKTLFETAGLYNIINIIAITGISAFTVQRVFFHEIHIKINIISILVVAFVLVLLYIADGMISYQCAVMFDSKTRWKVISFILPPLAAFWVAEDVRKMMLETHDERTGIFEGGKDWVES